MAAIIALPDEKVEEICASVTEGGEVCVPADYNCPGQIVISGSMPGIEKACEQMKAAGAKRALPLKVGGVKGYLKGVGIYGLPVLMFTLFEIGNSTLWIFGGHAGLYGSGLIGYIVVNVLLYITVGIEEELMFRSVVTECVLRKNSNIIVFASVYSGLLFGLAHITNFIFDADMTMFNKWCTMIMACVFGFTLAVIFLRTKSIGAIITLHFLWDFADFMNHMMIVERYRYGGSYNALVLQIPVLIVMLVIAVFCMYKRQMRLQSV